LRPGKNAKTPLLGLSCRTVKARSSTHALERSHRSLLTPDLPYLVITKIAVLLQVAQTKNESQNHIVLTPDHAFAIGITKATCYLRRQGPCPRPALPNMAMCRTYAPFTTAKQRTCSVLPFGRGPMWVTHPYSEALIKPDSSMPYFSQHTAGTGLSM